MQKTLYEFDSYRAYLLARMETKGRGERLAIAKHLSCQPSYVSRVLNGKADFSTEQAHGINELYSHSNHESRFFLLLVQFARAGTASLREFLQNEIREIRKARLQLRKRLDVTESLDPIHQAKFFSSWKYAAIQIAGSLPDCNSSEEIAERLKLPIKQVTETLEFLINLGLLVENKGKLELGPQNIFIGRDSAMINQHHTNWRVRTLESIDSALPTDVHFTSVMSISRKDALQLSETFVQDLARNQKVVNASKEEDIYAYCLDFYKL